MADRDNLQWSERMEAAWRALRDAGPGRHLVRDLGLPGSPIGWGLALAALERRGVVESVYPSDESAGMSKLWSLRGTR